MKIVLWDVISLFRYECPRGFFFENDTLSDPSYKTIEVPCLHKNGTYVVPLKWPNCTETINCPPPPPTSINGSR